MDDLTLGPQVCSCWTVGNDLYWHRFEQTELKTCRCKGSPLRWRRSFSVWIGKRPCIASWAARAKISVVRVDAVLSISKDLIHSNILYISIYTKYSLLSTVGSTMRSRTLPSFYNNPKKTDGSSSSLDLPPRWCNWCPLRVAGAYTFGTQELGSSTRQSCWRALADPWSIGC